MGHRMPDADSFGAAVGIYRIALTLGRKAHIVLNDQVPAIDFIMKLLVSIMMPEYMQSASSGRIRILS